MFNKMKFESPDITAENVAKIASLFPGVVTEGMVNFDLLRTMLGDEVFGDEAYEFTWVGKRAAIAEAGRPIRKTLRPCKEESRDWDSTENLYIEGDNLDVLKLLQESYLGKVKMIYIDPPYNTGNDFVYSDKFVQSREEYDEEAGVYDEEGDRLFKNTETNGRFHSDWCSMIYPRLVLARNLLRNDGAIFISIDENEQENIKKICNEVFGESNKVAEFVVIRAEGGGMAQQVIKGHDYLFVYANDITTFRPLGRPKDIRGKTIEKDGEKYWIQEDWLRKEFGKYGNCHYEEILQYKGQEKLDEINQGLAKGIYTLVPKANGMNIVGKLRNLKEDSSKFYSILKHLSANGIKDLQALQLDAIFSYPKPVSLVADLVAGMTFFSANSEDIILDFFSGSATTAHAVMQLNAEDGDNRKFIMVQLPEETDEKSEAYKAGFKNICEIGKERIRRAGDKILELSLENLEKEGVIIKDEGKLSEAGGLAEVYGLSGRGIPSVQKITEGRTLQSSGPDQESSGLDSEQHSRGASQRREGVYSIPENSQGLQGGVGNPAANMRTLKLLAKYGYRVSDAFIRGDFKDDSGINQKTKLSDLNSKLSIDIGFRVLKLDDTNMTDVYYGANETTQDLLAQMESNIKPDRTDLDLLFGCLLDWGLSLSMPHSSEKIDGFTVHTYNEGDLMACFEERISEKAIREIAERKPLRAVFRDSSFTSSPEKINVFEIFKLLAPNTIVKVI